MNHITTIGQVSIPVHQMEQSIHFYHEVLGLPLLFQAKNMAFLECNGLRLLLSIPEKEEFDHKSSIVYFQVSDIQKAFEDYRQKGVEFHGDPHLIAKIDNTETWMAFFQDPDGNIHSLMSEVQV
ncbi:VOC family protein [Falsibacillus pallidus]|uniref:VOC family protein n=1 Tax=Falsibacillus pallidus TaxID=493781 RepID=UPI003D95914A